jgi:uncharacterized membrane protein
MRRRLFVSGRLLRNARTNPWLALGCILLLATAIRLMALGTRLNNDDAYSWWVASAGSPHLFLSRLAASENTPPLIYLLMAPLPIDQPAWLRLPAVIPGILMCLAVYGAVRKPLGVRIALLAALAVATSPFLITDSNIARGFMLEDLALLVVLWAVLKLDAGASRRWWGVFTLAAVVALYTEYDSAIFLAAVTLAAWWTGGPSRRWIPVATGLSIASLIPWIPEMIRSQQQVGVTKLNPINGATSFTALRDAVVTLAFGEKGGASSSSAHWLEFAVILVVGVGAVAALRRRWLSFTLAGQRAIMLIAATAGGTLIVHAAAGSVGVQIFSQRYMTILIPLVAALAAAALVSLDRRALIVVVSVALTGLGLVNLVRRYHGEYQPDLTPVRLAAEAAHPRTVLTNTPLVLYYLRSLNPRMDRPYNLGPGLASTCARPCLIIDDSRVPRATPRQASGTIMTIGPFSLTLEH